MKKLMLMIAVVCAGVVVADTAGPRKKMTAAERRARRDARIAADGGLVERPSDGKAIRILSKTDKVSIAEVEEMAEEIIKLLGFKVEVVDSDKPTRLKTGCLIVLAEQEGAPTLLVAPENPWASVNVKNLAADNPTEKVLKTRIRKELWRAFAFAMGAANSNMQPCLMRPIFSLKDLDSEKVAIVCPEPLSAISHNAQRLNIAQARKTTYKRACMEGWAPAPTNDVQKAIAAQVKAEQSKEPTKGMKIKYDPKAGR